MLRAPFFTLSILLLLVMEVHSQTTQWPSPGLKYGSIFVCNPFDCVGWQNNSITLGQATTDTCGNAWYIFYQLTREENGRYYTKGTTCGDDKLLYDFNLITDDTLHNAFTGEKFLIYDHGDLPMLNGTSRRYQLVRPLHAPTSLPVRLIEGIGNEYYGFYPYRDFEGGHSRFICLKDSTGMIYEAGAPWSLDCDSLTCVVDYPSFTFECRNDTLVFTNTTKNISGALWDFGDGNTSTTTSPAHVFTQPGCYYVSLKTESDCIPGHWSEYVNVVNYESPVWWKKSPTMEQRELWNWQFLDEQHGWAYDSVHLYKTTDGGVSWMNVPYPGPIRRIYRIDFQDFAHGIVEVSNGNWFYSEILWTDNGTDFKTIVRDNFYSPVVLKRIDATTAFESEHYQDIAITRDSGTTWDTINNPAPITLMDGFQHFPGGPTYFSGTTQFGQFESWFCRSNNLEDWDCNYLGTKPYFRPFVFLDTLNGWSGQGGDIHRTYDAGRTWQRIADRSLWQGGIRDLFMLDSLNGWLTGHRNGVWRTKDGGYTWEQEACDLIPQSTSEPIAFSTTKAIMLMNAEPYERTIAPFQTNSCPTTSSFIEVESILFQVKLFPNPTSELVHYQITNLDNLLPVTDCILDVYDLYGRRVRSTVVDSESGMIDVKLLPTGTYYVRLRGKNVGEKIVIVR